MSSTTHPYAKSPPSKIATNDDKNVSMCDNSPSSKTLESEDLKKATREEYKEDNSSHNCGDWAAEE